MSFQDVPQPCQCLSGRTDSRPPTERVQFRPVRASMLCVMGLLGDSIGSRAGMGMGMGMGLHRCGLTGSDSGLQHRSAFSGASGSCRTAVSRCCRQGSHSRPTGSFDQPFDPQHAPKLGLHPCLSPPAGSEARLADAPAHPAVSTSASEPGADAISGGPAGSNSHLTTDAGHPAIQLHLSQAHLEPAPSSSPAGSNIRLTSDAGHPAVLLRPSQNHRNPPTRSPAGSSTSSSSSRRTPAVPRCQARRWSLGSRGCGAAASGQLDVRQPLGDLLQGTGLEGSPKQVGAWHRWFCSEMTLSHS